MDAYQVLGVYPEASQADIYQAYADLCQRYGMLSTPADVEQFVRVNAAFAVLTNPQTRQAADMRSGIIPSPTLTPVFETYTPTNHKVSMSALRAGDNRISQTTINNYGYIPEAEFNFGIWFAQTAAISLVVLGTIFAALLH